MTRCVYLGYVSVHCVWRSFGYANSICNSYQCYLLQLAHPLTHPPPTHSLTHPLAHSLTHSLTHQLTHSLTHSSTHPLTHPPTHPFTHSFTHPPTLTYSGFVKYPRAYITMIPCVGILTSLSKSFRRTFRKSSARVTTITMTSREEVRMHCPRALLSLS